MNKNKVAHIISFFTLPLWIPFFISLNMKETNSILWAVLSCVLLLGMVFFYKKIGILTTLQMPTRAERLLPLATSVIVYLFFSLFAYFYEKNIYPVFVLAFLCVFGLYIVNLWDKVSIHSAGITAGASYIIQFYAAHSVSIFIGILLILMVVWARLYLKAHTVKQIIYGFLTGIISYAITAVLDFFNLV